MRRKTGKKIISVFLIIIFIFNITGCATTTNYNDKNIDTKKQYTDENNEMIDSVLKDLNRKEKIKKDESNKIRAQIICGLIGAITFGGVMYLRAKYDLDKSSPNSPEHDIITFWIFFIGSLGAVAGYGLGGYLYDRGIIFNE